MATREGFFKGGVGFKRERVWGRVTVLGSKGGVLQGGRGLQEGAGLGEGYGSGLQGVGSSRRAWASRGSGFGGGLGFRESLKSVKSVSKFFKIFQDF